MLLFFHRKQNAHRGPCMAIHLLAAGLLLFATLLALAGLFLAHVDAMGVTLGSTSGSLAILAFSATLVLFLQHLRNCFAPCEICAAEAKRKKK